MRARNKHKCPNTHRHMHLHTHTHSLFNLSHTRYAVIDKLCCILCSAADENENSCNCIRLTMQPLSHCRDPLPSAPLLLHLPFPTLPLPTVPENQVIDVARRAWLHALNRCLGTGRETTRKLHGSWLLTGPAATSCTIVGNCFCKPSRYPAPLLRSCQPAFWAFIVEQVSSSMRTLLQSTCKFMPTLDLVPAKLLSQKPPTLPSPPQLSCNGAIIELLFL